MHYVQGVQIDPVVGRGTVGHARRARHHAGDHQHVAAVYQRDQACAAARLRRQGNT